jgi:hypothetical protein
VTGLVYLAIIALWAAFLIPWLSRHRDELHGRRSGDRYQRAMDSLAKASDDQQDEDDHADDLLAEDVGPAASPLPTPAQAMAIVGALLGRSGSSGRVVRRRRRVLAVLGAGFAAAVAGTLAGYLPGVAPVAFAGLLVVYLTVLVRTAARPATEGWAATGASDEHREAARRAQRQAQALLRARQSAAASGESGRWDAVPTTLPTYVTKPKAAKVPRVVDLTAPARGTAGEAMVARAQQERERSRKSLAQRQFEQEIAAVEPDALEEVAELVSPREPEEYRQPYRRAANG